MQSVLLRKTGFSICKISLFAFLLSFFVVPTESLTAKTRTKANFKKEFNQKLKVSCYEADNIFFKLRKKLTKKERLSSWIRLARCYRGYNLGYSHYKALYYYRKFRGQKNISVALRLEARFFLEWRHLRSVYFSRSNSRYFREMRERARKRIAALEKLVRSHQFSSGSRWHGELLMLEIRYNTRLRRFGKAWKMVRTLLSSGYPDELRSRAMLYAAVEIVKYYRPVGYPTNDQLRKIKAFKELIKVSRQKPYRAIGHMRLANLLRSKGAKSFGLSLVHLQKCIHLKVVRLSHTCKQLLLTLTSPTIQPMFPMQIAPDKPRKLVIHFSRLRKGTFALYRADLRNVFRQSQSIFDLDGLKLENEVFRQTLKLNSNQRINFNRPQHRQVSVLLKGLSAGTYVIEMSGVNKYKRGVQVRMPLFVSNAHLILKQSRKKLLVAMVDGRKSKPIRGAVLTYTLGTYVTRFYRYYRRYNHIRNRLKKMNPPNLKVHTATIGKKGIFQRIFKNARHNRQVHMMACAGKICTMGQSAQSGRYGPYRYFYHSWSRYRQLQHKVFWTTDRGAYRPGQTVFFKGIYHRQRYLRWEATKGLRVRVFVRDSKGKQLFKKLFTLAELGTFDGKFKLKKRAPLGVYNVSLQVMYRNKRTNYPMRTFYKSFRVEEYRRPKFVVRSVLKAGVFKAGDSLPWKISARYTFGGPVKGAKVRWTLRRESASPQFRFPRPFAYYFKVQRQYSRYYRYKRYRRYRRSDRYYYNLYKRRMESYRRYMRRYPRRRYLRRNYQRYRKLMLRYAAKLKPFAQGTGILDDKGALHITTKSIAGKGYWRYILTAEVTDVSRRTIKGSGSTILGRKSARVYLRVTRYMVMPGKKIEVLVRTLRPDNQGLAIKGMLYLVRSSDKHGALKDIAKKSITVKTNAEGKGAIRFFADFLGHFRLVYVGTLPSGKKIKAETSVWLGSDKLKHTSYAYKRLEVVTDRDLYKPGQQAHVLINTPNVPDSFLVTVEGEGLYWSSLIKSKGRSTLMSLPVLRSYAPNVWVTVSYVYQGTLRMVQRRIVVPPTHKFLNVAVTPFKKNYRPGEAVKWKVKVTDKKGRPVQSNLLLFAYDKSLDLIGKVAFPDIVKSFYDRQQTRGVTTASSRQSMLNFRFRLSQKDFDLVRPAGYRYSTLSVNSRSGRNRTKSILPGRPRGNSDSALRSPTPSFRGYRPIKITLSPPLSKGAPGQRAKLVRARKRTDFRETAVWLSRVNTNAQGEATVSFRWPDSLTSWSVRAVAVGKGVKIGAVQKVTRTNQTLMAQIAAPRFFTVGDKAKVAVVVFNRSKRQRVRVKLKVKGLEIIGKTKQLRWLNAGENKRFVFEVTATSARKVFLSAEVASQVAADAVEVKRQVQAFGLDRYASTAGSLFGKGQSGMDVRLPKVFSKNSSRLEIAVSSSLTRSIFDSLGYLVKFPYGCVEQTMSRFLPAALVAKTLSGLDKSEPKLAKKLPKVIKAGLDRLYNFQHLDGGWGWWQHDRTNDFMTAYVLFGLSTAKAAGYKINKGVMKRAASYLRGRVKFLRKQPALHSYTLYALSLVGKVPTAEIDYSLSHIKKLNSYGLAMLSLAYSKKGDASTASYVLKRLHARLTDVQGGAQAYFAGKGTLRGWSEDGVEATAVALRALIEAKAYKKDWPRIARWLLNHRKGKRWNSTRDTAQAILALSSFATAVGDGKGTRKVQVLVDGRVLKTLNLTASDAKNNGFTLALNDARLRKGVKRVSVRSLTKGPVYFGIQLKYRTEETNIPAGGSGILSVRRAYYEVLRKGSQVSFRRIRSGQPVKAGAEVEVRLTMRAKNKLSYLLFADRKPAGLEPIQIKSGAPKVSWLSHQEFRDTHVAFFAGTLAPHKNYTLKYRMRAERPGRYRTLPTVGGPMYVPKVTGHSSSFVFVITP